MKNSPSLHIVFTVHVGYVSFVTSDNRSGSSPINKDAYNTIGETMSSILGNRRHHTLTTEILYT